MKKFAVFDIDGTLIRWQLYHVIVDRLAKAGMLSETAASDIQQARMLWKQRDSPESFSAYEQVLIEHYESALKTIPSAEFDKLATNVIEEYKDQIYTYTRDLIDTLKNNGYFLLAISGSHHELVSLLAEHYGFDDFVGTQYERLGDSFSGKSYVASHHKQEILNELIKKHGLSLKDSYAVGDSSSDAPMLEIAEHGIAFNPDRKLFEIAQQKHWNIVVERKNMIYELIYKDGNYILA